MERLYKWGGDFDNEGTEDNFWNYVFKWREKIESSVKAEIWDQKKQRLLNHSKKKKKETQNFLVSKIQK